LPLHPANAATSRKWPVAPWSVTEALFLSIAVLAATNLVHAFGSASAGTIAINFLVSLVAVLSLSIFTGNSGVLSFGHVAFMALGAQISSTLTMAPTLKAGLLPLLPTAIQRAQYGFWLALAIAAVIVALVALIIGQVLCWLPVMSMSLSTLGVLIIVHSLMIASAGITRGNQAMHSIPKLSTIWVASSVALLAIFAATLFRASVPGLLLRSSRENEAAARSIGINVESHRLLAWVLSAVVAASAGALMAHHLTVFDPKTFYIGLAFSLRAYP
jgi:branched-chain amino acid transport system permease protein